MYRYRNILYQHFYIISAVRTVYDSTNFVKVRENGYAFAGFRFTRSVYNKYPTLIKV